MMGAWYRRFCLCFLLCLPITALGFSVHLLFVSRVVGHEEITRQAILLTKFVLEKRGENPSDELLAHMTRIEKMPLGLESVDIDLSERLGLIETDNPIVFGNFAADKPAEIAWLTKYDTDIYRRNGFPLGKDMLKWGGARSFHFTLNEYFSDELMNSSKAVPTYVGETPRENVFYQSGAEACYDARHFIVDYSQWGMEALAERARVELPPPPERNWQNGFGLSAEYKAQKRTYEEALKKRDQLLKVALFRFGVATHVIQDSFSPSHTFRSPEGGTVAPVGLPEYTNYDVIEVCYYDQVIPHAFSTAKEWAHNIGLQDSLDDKLNDEDQVVLRPELRLESSRRRESPCAHGNFDKNDNIWLSTNVQADILARQNWDRWEKEIWSEILRVSPPSVRDAHKLQRECNHNRIKSSEASAFKCLKHEARLARTATIKYFLVLLDHVKAYMQAGREDELASSRSRADLAQSLERKFFEGTDPEYRELGLNEIMPLGTMRCDRIQTPAYRSENGRFSLKQ